MAEEKDFDKNTSETTHALNNKNTSTEETKKTDDKADSKVDLKKIIKEGSGINILKISATALTAVSMALVSANLTGVVNSLMLVAILSVTTAIVSEFYRIVLSVTSIGAKKVVTPVLQTTIVKSENGRKTITITEETPILETDVDALVEDAESKAEIKELEEKLKETGQGKFKLFFAKLKKSFSAYFKNNPFMRFIILFAGIAMLTIGTSYFVSEGNQNTDSIFTTIYKTEEQKTVLSEEERQQIIDEAVIKAKESVPPTIVEKETETRIEESQAEQEVNPTSPDTNTNPSADPTTTLSPEQESSVSEEDIQTLIKRIEQLEKDNETLRKELDTINSSDSENPTSNNDTGTVTPSATTDELQEQIDELQRQINDLNNSSETDPAQTGATTSNNAPNSIS